MGSPNIRCGNPSRVLCSLALLGSEYLSSGKSVSRKKTENGVRQGPSKRTKRSLEHRASCLQGRPHRTDAFPGGKDTRKESGWGSPGLQGNPPGRAERPRESGHWCPGWMPNVNLRGPPSLTLLKSQATEQPPSRAHKCVQRKLWGFPRNKFSF